MGPDPPPLENHELLYVSLEILISTPTRSHSASRGMSVRHSVKYFDDFLKKKRGGGSGPPLPPPRRIFYKSTLSIMFFKGKTYVCMEISVLRQNRVSFENEQRYDEQIIKLCKGMACIRPWVPSCVTQSKALIRD